MADLARRLAVARGDEPADLVLTGGRVLSVFTREWLDADLAIVDGWIAGLGDYDGAETIVVAGDPRELSKLALHGAEHADGHAPGLTGKELNAYAASGIRSDHEALTLEEGRERLRAGIWLLVREASMARNLTALAPLISE